MSHIYLGGSRSLSPSSALWSQAQNLTQHIIYCTPHAVHVGCATGADQAVILALGGGSCQAHIFAAFGPTSHSLDQLAFPLVRGFFSASAVQSVIAAHNLGLSVHWWAGGSFSVPLAARLINRSVAALRGSCAAVFFAPGSGSLTVASHAVKACIPVFAFGDLPAPIPSCAGQWVASSFMGFACWSWSSAQLSLF